MIPPREQIIHQLCVTSLCWPKTPDGTLTGCSNCTRLLAHEKKRYFMTPEQFSKCVMVARDFIYESKPCPQGRKMKVLGIFGGEPLMSPYFPDYVTILCDLVPEPEHRGLWTSLDWKNYVHPRYGNAEWLVNKLLNGDGKLERKGFLNWNMHTEQNHCEHHGNLIAIEEMIPDKKEMWSLINKCWLNRDWSACYALDKEGEPKFYFCELASSFDRVMGLGTGLDVTPYIWNGDLYLEPDANGILQPKGPYANQVLSTCTKCGQALPLQHGRRDLDNIDDISPGNLKLLQIAGSPMVERGDYEVVSGYEKPSSAHHPGTYIKSGTILSSRVPR